MIRRLSLTKRLDLVCIALAFASTGMSCNQNTAEVPPVPTGTAEAVPAANTSESESGETVQVRFETTKGNFVVEVHPDWAPVGAARFRELVAVGFYDECRFFRVIPGFMVQWGMNGDPQVHTPWSENTIQDDPVIKSNTRGFMTFAKTGMPNSRSTQLFINFGNNSRLDADGFAPFAVVTEGMDVVDSINAEYGESPRQDIVQRIGNDYLAENFPRLDSITKASIVTAGDQPADAAADIPAAAEK